MILPINIWKGAKQSAKEGSLNMTRLRFYEGDPYNVSNVLLRYDELNFDAIIIMFNSLGVKEDEDDLLMLRDLVKIASNYCTLVIQVENRDWRLRNFHPNIIQSSIVWKYIKRGDLTLKNLNMKIDLNSMNNYHLIIIFYGSYCSIKNQPEH
jgi:hypothetical protein